MNFFDLKPKRVVCDSRKVKQGDLFFALPGEFADGHDFVEDALSKGAIGAVVGREMSVKGPLYVVDSPLQALQNLAKRVLEQKKPIVVAITGSVGKTTTKEYVAHVLSKKYRVAKSPGNYNSKVGLPLTILNELQDEEILVLEMGMTEEGHIKDLVAIAPPDIALITNVSLVHSCNFEGLSSIARAKAEIFSHPKTKFRLAHKDTLSFKEIEANMTYGGTLGLNLPHHLEQNALGAALVARLLGVEESLIAKALLELTVLEGRGNLVEKNSIFFYNDAYNASEVSMIAALSELEKREGRKVAVLGQMLELGIFSEECHRRVGVKAAQVADLVLCLGKECYPLYEMVKDRVDSKFFLHLEDLLACLKKSLREKDHVLLKGSNGNQLWKLLDDYGTT